MKLDAEQLAFLKINNIPLDKVLDASGMSRAEYGERMKSLGFIVAVGVTECSAGGHSMRNRSGHCVLCNTAALTFQGRYSKAMYLYIAQPSYGHLTKVGITDNVDERTKQLNSHKLGGFTTWTMKYSVLCENAGQVEHDVGALLAPFKKSTVYQSKQGQVSREVYACTFDQALNAINRVLDDPPMPLDNSRKSVTLKKVGGKIYVTKSM